VEKRTSPAAKQVNAGQAIAVISLRVRELEFEHGIRFAVEYQTELRTRGDILGVAFHEANL
jgi:hypothetical protein